MSLPGSLRINTWRSSLDDDLQGASTYRRSDIKCAPFSYPTSGTPTALGDRCTPRLAGARGRDFMDIEDLHRVVVQGFASVHDRFDSVDARLGRVEDRIGRVNQKIDALQIHMNAEFGRVKDALMEHGRQLEDIRAALDRGYARLPARALGLPYVR